MRLGLSTASLLDILMKRRIWAAGGMIDTTKAYSKLGLALMPAYVYRLKLDILR